MRYRELCRQFSRTGACSYGDQCRFLHQATTSPRMVQTAAWSPDGAGPGGQQGSQPHYSYDDRHGQPAKVSLPTFTEREWAEKLMAMDGSPSGPRAAQGGTSTGAGAGSNSRAEPFPFRLMTYNLLSDELAHQHYQELYLGTAKQYLAWWEHRWPLTLSEITAYQPDILCLQEVDAYNYEQLASDLETLGYQGCYAQRTGDRGDGCATFWQHSRLRVLQQERVCMRDHGLKDNVALLVALTPAAGAPHATQQQQHEEGEGHMQVDEQQAGLGGQTPQHEQQQQQQQQQQRVLVLGNTHILFNNRRGDIKLGQVRTALSRMHDMAVRLSHPTAARDAQALAACILCGDFNTSPGSGVYRFLSDGVLHLPSHDRRDLSGQCDGWGFQQYQRDLRAGRPMLQGYCPRPPPDPQPQPQAPSHPPAYQQHIRFDDNGEMESEQDQQASGKDQQQAAAAAATIAAIMHGGSSGAPAEGPGAQTSTAAGQQGVPQVDSYAGPYTPAIYPPWQGQQAGSTGGPTDPIGPLAPTGHAPSPPVRQQQEGTAAEGRAGAAGEVQQQKAGVPQSATPQSPSGGMHTPDETSGARTDGRTPSSLTISPQHLGYSQGSPGGSNGARHRGHRGHAPRHVHWEEEELHAAMGMEAATQLLGALSIHQFQGRPNQRQVAYMHEVRKARRAHSSHLVARHPLRVRSAYVEATGREPTFTTCHLRSIDTVDYIWFTPYGVKAHHGHHHGHHRHRHHHHQQGAAAAQDDHHGAGSTNLHSSKDDPAHGHATDARGAGLESLAGSSGGAGNAPGQQQQQGAGDGGQAASHELADEQVLHVVRVLLPPDSVRMVVGMPNANWASDHICLVADMTLG